MYKQTNKDFKKSLKEQLGFLNKSCFEYDKGDVSEAKRIALVLRVLLHDTKTSKSLLNLLGIKSKISLLDTSGEITFKESHAVCNFINLRYELISGTSEIEPTFDKYVQLNYLPFNDWWDKVIYYDPITGNKLPRKQLILTTANKDGGAHIDESINNATYIDLTRNNAFGWKATINGNSINTEKALYAMIRQVAFEVMNTLKRK